MCWPEKPRLFSFGLGLLQGPEQFLLYVSWLCLPLIRWMLRQVAPGLPVSP